MGLASVGKRRPTTWYSWRRAVQQYVLAQCSLLFDVDRRLSQPIRSFRSLLFLARFSNPPYGRSRGLRVYRSVCKRNSRSQIEPYSGLQTMRTKRRDCAGQMEEENRRWIELGGRWRCWKRELLTHLVQMSVLQYCRWTDGNRLTVAFAGRLVQRKLSVAWEREIPARARCSLDARLLVYRNKPSLSSWQQTPARSRPYFSPSSQPSPADA